MSVLWESAWLPTTHCSRSLFRTDYTFLSGKEAPDIPLETLRGILIMNALQQTQAGLLAGGFVNTKQESIFWLSSPMGMQLSFGYILWAETSLCLHCLCHQKAIHYRIYQLFCHLFSPQLFFTVVLETIQLMFLWGVLNGIICLWWTLECFCGLLALVIFFTWKSNK